MSDHQESGTRESVQLSLALNMGKLKFPANPPPLPPEFYPLIGIVALAWGMYDVLFNRLLAALLAATGDATEPRWRAANYRRRRWLCRKNIRAYFSAESGLKNYLETLLDESAEIHNKRNAIIHRSPPLRRARPGTKPAAPIGSIPPSPPIRVQSPPAAALSIFTG
jgi:hypothetical protein